MATRGNVQIDIAGRDPRFLRGVHDVEKNYTIRWNRRKKGVLRADVSGGTKDYQVVLYLTEIQRPTCSCPDARARAKRVSGGYCKHLVAVLMRSAKLESEPEQQSYWLLDAFL